MGAWGPEPFENDAALDWLLAAEEDASAVGAAFDEAGSAGYLDADVGSSAVAAAALLAAAIDGEVSALPDEAREVVPTIRVDDALRRRAAQALAATLGEQSELRALWAEADDEPRWRDCIARLRARIVGDA